MYTVLYIVQEGYVFLFMGIPSVEQEHRQLNLGIGRLRVFQPRDGNRHA